MSLVETHSYTLPSGAVIAIENLGEARHGIHDVALFPRDRGGVAFDSVLAPLGEVCESIVDKIRTSVKAPQKVTLELSASLKGKTGLVIVCGEAQGAIKLTLTWENPSRARDHEC